jgi:hypothetical protein
MARRKRPVNEFEKRPPNAKEVKAAQKLARRVDPTLLALMEANTVKDAA